MNDELQILIEQYSNMVYRLAIAQMGNKEDGEDIYQEVFLRLLKNTKSFKSEEHCKAWLIRVTINCCNTLHKSAYSRKVVLGPQENTQTVDDLQITEYSDLFLAVQQLPDTYRTIIHLYYYEGYRTKEIAKLLGQLESTIRSKLLRGRKQLRKLLEGSQYEQEFI